MQARICALTIVNLSCSSQIINNIALNEFDTDVSLYTATLKDVIAACMDGVSPEEIIDMVVEDVTSSAVAASLLRGGDVTVQSSGSIRVTYTVTVTVTDDGTYGTLSSELVDAVNNGEFNDYLDEYGNSTGAVYLVGATSNSVTITNINANDDNSDGSGLRAIGVGHNPRFAPTVPGQPAATFTHACAISSTVRSPYPTHVFGSGFDFFAVVLSCHAVMRISVPFGRRGAASSAYT